MITSTGRGNNISSSRNIPSSSHLNIACKTAECKAAQGSSLNVTAGTFEGNVAGIEDVGGIVVTRIDTFANGNVAQGSQNDIAFGLSFDSGKIPGDTANGNPLSGGVEEYFRGAGFEGVGSNAQGGGCSTDTACGTHQLDRTGTEERIGIGLQKSPRSLDRKCPRGIDIRQFDITDGSCIPHT